MTTTTTTNSISDRIDNLSAQNRRFRFGLKWALESIGSGEPEDVKQNGNVFTVTVKAKDSELFEVTLDCNESSRSVWSVSKPGSNEELDSINWYQFYQQECAGYSTATKQEKARIKTAVRQFGEFLVDEGKKGPVFFQILHECSVIEEDKHGREYAALNPAELWNAFYRPEFAPMFASDDNKTAKEQLAKHLLDYLRDQLFRNMHPSEYETKEDKEACWMSYATGNGYYADGLWIGKQLKKKPSVKKELPGIGDAVAALMV